MINKSLSSLGIVINSLVEQSEGKNRFVPYRDSKLTFLLRDSLGGNSKTAIVANISAAFSNLSETFSTLKFAQRAKLIQNKAVINQESSGTLVLLKTEIQKLKRELNAHIQMNLQLKARLSSIGVQDSHHTFEPSDKETDIHRCLFDLHQLIQQLKPHHPEEESE